ncbi:MAG TPA: amidase family protein [Patescibacteria group bacterium]|nr:amidase family protein [Patescibacteria group bacterium]
MLRNLTLKQYLDKVKAREISPDDVLAEINEAIDQENPKLNIYLARNKNPKSKLQNPNSLLGAPLAIKDNFLTKGLVTTASSKVLENFKPPYESTVTKKLKEAGAAIIGKTNMDAWAHGSSTETSDFGPTKNPRNLEYLPGGSSGGSAAAVAADLCIAAIGSETAGSIRQPASWCGIVGLKPTYGRVSRAGVVAMGSSLDSPGPMGKTVDDTAILLNIIAGSDKYDGTTSKLPVPDFTKEIKKGVKGLRIGLLYSEHEKIKGTVVANALQQAGKVFENLGATVETAKAMKPDLAIAVYTVVQRSEVSSNLARYDGVRYGNDRSFFGEEARRRIMLGTFTLSKGYSDKYYVKAQQVRSMYIQNYNELFEKYDLLISPTSPGFAQKIGALGDNPMFGELADMLVEPSSISGLPGINVPMYHDQKTNLYLGLNIVAPMWQEERMIQAAYAYEQATEWNAWIK